MKTEQKTVEIPELSQLEQELVRVRQKKRRNSILRSTICGLTAVIAIAILIASVWLSILQIYGTSMTPTLLENEMVISVKSETYDNGDIVAFYNNNRILVRRVIAGPGSWVHIDSKGNVLVDGAALEEPYLSEKALGQCDLELPYQVPDNCYFVMGDNRSASVDSRSSVVGCVSIDQMVGKVIFRFWPFESLGALN